MTPTRQPDPWGDLQDLQAHITALMATEDDVDHYEALELSERAALLSKTIKGIQARMRDNARRYSHDEHRIGTFEALGRR